MPRRMHSGMQQGEAERTTYTDRGYLSIKSAQVR